MLIKLSLHFQIGSFKTVRKKFLLINSKTVETYLPPIPSKVVEFTTIERYLEYLEKLSMSCNMPFVNIALDVGVAMNPFKFVWSNPVRFKNVVIQLGDFHFIKENFQKIYHLVFWDSVTLSPQSVGAKLWLWSWSVHFPSSRTSSASRFRKSGEEKYICSLLRAS